MSSTSSINVVSSVIDVQSIVDNLIEVARQPEILMQNRVTQYSNKVTAFQTLNTKLSAFMDKVTGILYNGDSPLLTPYSFQDRLDGSIFSLRKAASSDDATVSATASQGTASGTYAITVSDLAQAKTMASANFADIDTTSAGTGSLVIQVGSNSPVTVNINSSNSTLAGIRNAINAAGAGVTATIINDGSSSPYRLLITSDQTGTANAFTLTNNLSGGTSLNLTQTQAATDAQFTVNSISITKSSNTISDVIDGVTLNLKSLTSDPVTVTVGSDIDSIVSSFKAFANAYNDLNTFYSSQFHYNGTTKKAGVLSGDSTVRSVQSRVQQLLAQSVTNGFTSYNVITQIGFNFNNDGSLTVNERKLRNLLATDLQGVAALMLGNGNPAQADGGSVTDSRVTYSGKTGATQAGTYSVQVTGLAEQAFVVGQKSFTQLDSDETLTITHGSKVTTVDLLNGDDFETVLSTINSVLTANGDTVTAADDGTGKIKISTDNYGNAESIFVTSTRTGNPDNSTGFGNNPSDSGVDIAGTINGHDAVGSGLTLTGATGQAEEGLSLTIAQTTTGSYGSVTVTLAAPADEGASILSNLRTALKGITDPLEGPIHHATDSLNKNISRTNDEISQFEDRLEVQRQLLTDEYSRADQALRLLTVNQTSLSNQLSSLQQMS